MGERVSCLDPSPLSRGRGKGEGGEAEGGEEAEGKDLAQEATASMIFC